MAIVYDGLASGRLCCAWLVVVIGVFRIIGLTGWPILLVLIILLALASCLLTVLLGLTLCGTLSSNAYLSVGAIEIAPHQQEDEYDKKENKAKKPNRPFSIVMVFS